jgi:predicted GNAT family N-acyltransferase
LSDRSRSRLRIEVLSSEHDRDAFSSRVSDLDSYIRERAGQDARRHIATVFVLLEGGPAVLGYYTLSQQVISLEDVPMAIAKRLPRYPLLPATLIGRLAIDGVRQGEGLGQLLLMDALFRSWQAAQTVASFAVRVDATGERARDFYLRHDFLSLPKEHLKLFLPMAHLDRLFLGVVAASASVQACLIWPVVFGAGPVKLSNTGAFSKPRR